MTLSTISTPPRGAGRPRITGTVLADTVGPMVLVKRSYSLPENPANTGYPRVEVWVALHRDTLRPVVVRRAGDGDWHTVRAQDLGERFTEVHDSIRACRRRITDVWPGNPSPDWPTSPWDARVVLPDDWRWAGGRNAVAAAIERLLCKRNTCPDYQVWAIDAQVITMAEYGREYRSEN